MFAQECCTYIPNNTAPDGSVTRALTGLKTLSEELAENSGISSLFGDWFDKTVGKWKSLISSALLALVMCATLSSCWRTCL